METEEMGVEEATVSDPTGLICVHCQHPLEHTGSTNVNRWVSTINGDSLFGCNGFSEYDYMKARDGSKIVLHEPWVGAAKGEPRPVIKEADPDLERLLAEEEEIVRRVRMAQQIAEGEAQIRLMNEQIIRLQTTNDNQHVTLDKYRADVEMIGEALVEEAESREWCDEYETFVNRLNDRLKIVELPIRQRRETATYTVQVTVTVEYDKDDSSWNDSSYLADTIREYIRDHVQDSDQNDDLEYIRVINI